ncbi:MAG: hypothetical protein V3T31_09230, partial [candidate division Zixibacteria bacterium]
EYLEAKNFTKLQSTKIGARELVEGHTYAAKDTTHLIYLGRHMWYEQKYRRDKDKRDGKKVHIFCDMEGKNHRAISSVPSTIAAVVDANCHDQFATWVDDYLKSHRSSKIVDWVKKPIPEEVWDEIEWDKEHYQLYDTGKKNQLEACIESGGKFYTVAITKKKGRWNSSTGGYDNTDTLTLQYNRRQRVNKDDGAFIWDSSNGHTTLKDRSEVFDLYAVFENGTEQKWRER